MICCSGSGSFVPLLLLSLAGIRVVLRLDSVSTPNNDNNNNNNNNNSNEPNFVVLYPLSRESGSVCEGTRKELN